jgi:hypothetical protein
MTSGVHMVVVPPGDRPSRAKSTTKPRLDLRTIALATARWRPDSRLTGGSAAVSAAAAILGVLGAVSSTPTRSGTRSTSRGRRAGARWSVPSAGTSSPPTEPSIERNSASASFPTLWR